MQIHDLTLEVRDRTLKRVGQITPAYLDLSARTRWSNVGEWKVTLPGSHPMVPYLATKGSGVILLGPDGTADNVILSGPTRAPSRVRNRQNPDGTYTFSGVTDEVILMGAVAFPDPAIGVAQDSSRSRSNDTRTGVTEDLMRAFVSLNVTAAGAPAARVRGLRQYLALEGVSGGRGLSQIKSPRFQNLLELLQEMVAYDPALGFRVVQVGSALRFQVLDSRDRTKFIRFDVENGSITSEEVQESGPVVTDAIVAGQGDGVDRTIIQRTTAASEAAEEEWGIPWERFIDQRNTDDLDELAQSGDEALLDNAGGTAVKMVPSDDTTMQVGVDWRAGDKVTAVVNGVETVARVTEVAYLANKDAVMAGAAIGDVSGFTQTDAQSAQVASLDERVSNLERASVGLVPGSTVTGVLAHNYRNGGRAMVHVGGLTAAATGPYRWQSEYVPAGSREVTLVWTGSTWEIQGQRENISYITVNLTEWDGYGRLQLDRAWNDRVIATKLATGLVVLGGLLRAKATPTAGGLVATIEDPTFWPEKDVVLPVEYGDQPRAVIVQTNGRIISEGPPIATQYLSLDGVAYWAADSEATGNWTTVGAAGSGSSFAAGVSSYAAATYGPVQYYKDRYGFVWFRGLLGFNVGITVDNTSLIVLPPSHRASSEQHYRSVSVGQYGGLGARTTDGLNWKMGSNGSVGAYMSPSGATICTTDALTLNEWFVPVGLLNSWVQYGAGYPPLSITRRGDGLVKLRGMIANGVQGATITNLVGQEECIPRGRRLILPSMANNARGRMDVVGNSEDAGRAPKDLFWISAAAGVSWVSLDSMLYVT